MQSNYQKELDGIIDGLNGNRPSLLLHVCCAPCSSYVLEYLSKYFEIYVYYYNPNITPESEFRKRADEEKRLIGEMPHENDIHYIEGKYDPNDFFEVVKGLENEPEGGARCTECFKLRLYDSARICREKDFDYFTTTLTISPLKDADRLNSIGMDAAKEYGVKWLPCDFKKKNGYLRSIQLSKEYSLYRQSWCGCIYSKSTDKN